MHVLSKEKCKCITNVTHLHMLFFSPQKMGLFNLTFKAYIWISLLREKI